MYKRILVPIDGSTTADGGLREAIGLAAAMKAQLVLLHVIDDFSMLVEVSSVTSYSKMMDRLRQRGQDILESARLLAADSDVQAQTCLREVAQARIAGVVVNEAVRQSCDLIVMGTHGRHGFNRLTMGSNAESVVRSSTIPALLVKRAEAAFV
ncbi:universal stress protein [Caenimonas sp. SL110]|uniref:universal stress protein n=1 Tax=Caenimonas sp. SL110 TaxID=1450524 RepID=UPI00065450A5|nr:universal stress protein [Caenimonas sp. SL110]